jgi:hypothetical protein
MTSDQSSIEALRIKLGVNRVRDHLSTIQALGEQMTANAPTGSAPCCAWDAGNIARQGSLASPSSTPRILLDLGGTHTKVATISPTGEWQLLFDHNNEWFKNQRAPSLSSIAGFFRVLAHEIRQRIPQGVPVRVGVIWSNQITTKRFETSTTRGVTGIVSGLDSGGYRKGEWFLHDLVNGDDLGALLLCALHEQNIQPEVLVFGNDTLFTLFAAPSAHAGVVMSSGGNCTLVGTDATNKDDLFNSELGGMLLIPHQALSDGDLALLKKKNASTLALEELCAGNWFAESVHTHLEIASQYAEGAALRPLLQADLEISNRSLSAFIAKEPNAFIQLDLETQTLLRDITSALIDRASLLAGLLTYLSVIDQVKAGLRKVTVSLDSSMARHFQGYLNGIQNAVNALRPKGVEISIELIHPIELPEGTEISVPMQGLAQIISNYEPAALTLQSHA